MSNTNAPTSGSTSPQDSMLRRQTDASAATAARSAETEALIQYRNRTLVGANTPFASTAGFGLGLGAPMAASPFLSLQHEMLRRQEIERILASASASGLAFPGRDSDLDVLSRREQELIGLRSAQNHIIEAELAGLSTGRDRIGATSLGGMFPMAAASAGVGGFGLGSLDLGLRAGAETEATEMMRANQQHALAASMPDAAASQAAVSSELARLSADERDRLSEAADQTYRSALEAKGLPGSGLASGEEERKMGDKDLAHEAELHDSVQRQLMEQEAMAEQQKAVVSRNQLMGVGGAGLGSVEQTELFRRRQQEELFRFVQMQQFQLPGDNLFGLQSRIGGAMPLSLGNPYSLLGGLSQIPAFPTMAPTLDQAAMANFEKAYTAEGTPENDIIAKFLNVVTSRVPEIMDMLALFFPFGLVDNPQKFYDEFPRVVEATMAELKMMQDRASKENGYKSRGLYDRVTNCIAAIAPYMNITNNYTGAAGIPGIQDSQTASASEVASSKPAANLPSAAKAPQTKAGVPTLIGTWTCHKCGNDNLATKARCSTCQMIFQGWKGGVRENKPKKRKQPKEESAETVQKKEKAKKKKVVAAEKDSKKASKASAESPSKLNHVLLKKRDGKSTKAKQLTNKETVSDSTIDGERKICKTSETDGETNNGKDRMDAANVLLGLMGSSSGSSN